MSRSAFRRAVQGRRAERLRPGQLNVFSFDFPTANGYRRAATVLVRGKMGQVAAIGPAGEQVRTLGYGAAFCTDIHTVPAPRPTPALDRLCRQHTAFSTFLALLTAGAAYRPSTLPGPARPGRRGAGPRLRPATGRVERPPPGLRHRRRASRGEARMNAALVQHASSPDASCWFCGQPEVLEIGNILKVRWSRTLRPQAKPTPHPIPQSAPAAAPLWIGDPASPGPCSL